MKNDRAESLRNKIHSGNNGAPRSPREFVDRQTRPVLISTTEMSHSTGALPPPGFEWQTGKTAASILWVNYLAKHGAQNVESVVADVIEAFKSGVLVATQFPPNE